MDKNNTFQKFMAFTAAVHQITNEMTKDLKTKAITPVQYKILEYIAANQPVTLSEISQCMHMSMPNTSRELRKLTERQLCEKDVDDEDRRKQSIRLSDSGTMMMNEAFQRIELRFIERMHNVSMEELQEIEHALDLLHHKVFNKAQIINS